MVRGRQSTDTSRRLSRRLRGAQPRTSQLRVPGRVIRVSPAIRQNTHTTRLSALRGGKFHYLFTILSADCALRCRAQFARAVRVGIGHREGDLGTIVSDDRHHVRHGRKPANPCGDTRASALTRGQA